MCSATFPSCLIVICMQAIRKRFTLYLFALLCYSHNGDLDDDGHDDGDDDDDDDDDGDGDAPCS